MAWLQSEDIDPMDVTQLTDRGLPKSWKCPHCGKRNKFDDFAEELLMRYFKVFRHCENCGYVHMWELTLTENFKNEVVQFLLHEMRGTENDDGFCSRGERREEDEEIQNN